MFRIRTLSPNPISVAVIGVGAFGKNHARVYHQLSQKGVPVRLTAIVDTDHAKAQAIAKEYHAPSFRSVNELLAREKIDAASVAVPTIAHAEVATQLLKAGVDVLVEKPVTSTLEEADQLLRLAEEQKRIVQPGHLERFNPAVRATYPVLNKPLFFEVHRLSVFTPRSLDVDVVLDLMIHDLDIVLSFVKSPVKHIHAVGIPILTHKVDIANVRVEFESGCVANFTASRVSTERVRKIRFFQPHQYLSIDYSRQDLLTFTIDPKGTNPVPGQADSMIQIRKPPVTPGEPLEAEVRAFIEAVQNRSKPVVTLDEGRRALALALQILTAIRAHNERIQP